MKTRQLSWEDVHVKVGTVFRGLKNQREIWKNRRGETRVYCCLNNLSAVNHTFWILDFNENNPATKAAILLVLQRALRKLVHRVKLYEI